MPPFGDWPLSQSLVSIAHIQNAFVSLLIIIYMFKAPTMFSLRNINLPQICFFKNNKNIKAYMYTKFKYYLTQFQFHGFTQRKQSNKHPNVYMDHVYHSTIYINYQKQAAIYSTIMRMKSYIVI